MTNIENFRNFYQNRNEKIRILKFLPKPKCFEILAKIEIFENFKIIELFRKFY